MMIQTLADALAAKGYETLTDVQQAVTDPELQDADLLVSAQTGSGKTVAFGIAIAKTLMGEAEVLPHASAPLALVIAPTRELALQVKRELDWLYAKAGARIVSCVGGMDQRTERRALERGSHIVVGTPGRLRDHITRGAMDMSELKAVVLDEADEMLDLGFREDLEFMLGEAPKERRTLMFSATVSPLITKLAQNYQRDAKRVSTVSNKAQHADISYQALQVAPKDTENAIINLLRYQDAQTAIVFANTRATVNRLATRLSNRGLSVVSLSGELSQNERTHSLQAMRDGRARVCVATDVAARGIDLPNLELVIHAELPTNTEGLLHRSGRTGRAGRKGISALIVPMNIARKAERLLKWAKIDAEWTTPPSADMIRARDTERLMEHPMWNEAISEEEAGLAADLMGKFSPEQIASACLKMHRAQFSAPEELSPPDAKPERREKRDFGPSTWFSLTIGRTKNAEARWLLPMLCRTGNIDKSAIGAIRVQQEETFVELTQESSDRFLSALNKGELEDGIKVTKLDKAPNLSTPPRGKHGAKGGFKRDERPAKPHRKGPGADRAPSDHKPSDRKPSKPLRPQNQRDDRATAPSANKGGRWSPELTKDTQADYKIPAKKSEEAGSAGKAKVAAKDAGTPFPKPKADKKRDAEGKKQRWKNDKPNKKSKAGGRDDKPGGKPGGKFAGKPGGKPAGKPAGKGKPRKDQPRGANAAPRRTK